MNIKLYGGSESWTIQKYKIRNFETQCYRRRFKRSWVGRKRIEGVVRRAREDASVLKKMKLKITFLRQYSLTKGEISGKLDDKN